MNADTKQSLDTLVGNATKLTKERTALQIKLRALSDTIDAGKESYKGLVQEVVALRQKIKDISVQNMTLKSECDGIERELESEKANQSSLSCTVDALNNKRNILENDTRERYGKYLAERDSMQECNVPEAFNDAGAQMKSVYLFFDFLI